MRLPKRHSDSVALLLLSDEPGITDFVNAHLVDPTISFATASLLDHKNLIQAATSADIVVFHVGKFGFQHSIRALDVLQTHAFGITTLILDSAATPERAVLAIKGGADDYSVLRGKSGDLLPIIEQICFEHVLSHPGQTKQRRASRQQRYITSLNVKIRELVKAAGRLAECTSLQDVCEGLIETLGGVLGATGGSFYLMKSDYLQQVHSLDPGHAPERLSLPLEEGTVFDRVYRSGEPILITSEMEIEKHKSSGWEGYEADNLLVYPLLQKDGELIGIFSLHGKRHTTFTKEDRDIVLILASYTRETIRALYAQEKSAETFDSLRMTFENMNQGIVLLNSEREIVHYNQKFLSLTDIPNNLLWTGQSIAQIYQFLFDRGDQADRMEGKCPWIELSEDYEYLHRCSNKTIIHVSGNYVESGGFVLTFTDITSQKEWEVQLCLAKERAEAASASKTNFLANVSHELRTPLNAIIGFSEMIDSEVFGAIGNERYAEYIQHIHESGSHLLHLINNLLDLSKVEAGKFQLQESDVHLSQLISKTLQYCEKQASEAGVSLALIEAQKIGEIRADENALRQIVLNLLSNAIKFTPKGGTVTVFIDRNGDGDIKIIVQDTGIGMEEKSIHVAMEPFGQVENAFNRKYPGTGLGLPLVASLVELHGGIFNIQSQIGEGTTCSLSIPFKHAA